jgi:hypothetical protein
MEAKKLEAQQKIDKLKGELAVYQAWSWKPFVVASHLNEKDALKESRFRYIYKN